MISGKIFTQSLAALGLATFAAPVLLLAAAPAFAAAPPAGDAAAGAKAFLQCRACHSVGAAEPSGVGPNLYGVMGAKAAGKAGYAYSPALTAANLVWTPEKMDAWLLRPTAVVPGTRMAFAGVSNPKMRQDLIAYLQTLGAAKAKPAKAAKKS